MIITKTENGFELFGTPPAIFFTKQNLSQFINIKDYSDEEIEQILEIIEAKQLAICLEKSNKTIFHTTTTF